MKNFGRKNKIRMGSSFRRLLAYIRSEKGQGFLGFIFVVALLVLIVTTSLLNLVGVHLSFTTHQRAMKQAIGMANSGVDQALADIRTNVYGLPAYPSTISRAYASNLTVTVSQLVTGSPAVPQTDFEGNNLYQIDSYSFGVTTLAAVGNTQIGRHTRSTIALVNPLTFNRLVNSNETIGISGGGTTIFDGFLHVNGVLTFSGGTIYCNAKYLNQNDPTSLNPNYYSDYGVGAAQTIVIDPSTSPATKVYSQDFNDIFGMNLTACSSSSPSFNIMSNIAYPFGTKYHNGASSPPDGAWMDGSRGSSFVTFSVLNYAYYSGLTTIALDQASLPAYVNQIDSRNDGNIDSVDINLSLLGTGAQGDITAGHFSSYMNQTNYPNGMLVMVIGQAAVHGKIPWLSGLNNKKITILATKGINILGDTLYSGDNYTTIGTSENSTTLEDGTGPASNWSPSTMNTFQSSMSPPSTLPTPNFSNPSGDAVRNTTGYSLKLLGHILAGSGTVNCFIPIKNYPIPPVIPSPSQAGNKIFLSYDVQQPMHVYQSNPCADYPHFNTNQNYIGAVVLTGGTVGTTRGIGLTDLQGGITADPNAQVTGSAWATWYHRDIDITSLAGKTFQNVTLGYEMPNPSNSSASDFELCYANIRITELYGSSAFPNVIRLDLFSDDNIGTSTITTFDQTTYVPTSTPFIPTNTFTTTRTFTNTPTGSKTPTNTQTATNTPTCSGGHTCTFTQTFTNTGTNTSTGTPTSTPTSVALYAVPTPNQTPGNNIVALSTDILEQDGSWVGPMGAYNAYFDETFNFTSAREETYVDNNCLLAHILMSHDDTDCSNTTLCGGNTNGTHIFDYEDPYLQMVIPQRDYYGGTHYVTEKFGLPTSWPSSIGHVGYNADTSSNFGWTTLSYPLSDATLDNLISWGNIQVGFEATNLEKFHWKNFYVSQIQLVPGSYPPYRQALTPTIVGSFTYSQPFTNPSNDCLLLLSGGNITLTTDRRNDARYYQNPYDCKVDAYLYTSATGSYFTTIGSYSGIPQLTVYGGLGEQYQTMGTSSPQAIFNKIRWVYDRGLVNNAPPNLVPKGIIVYSYQELLQ